MKELYDGYFWLIALEQQFRFKMSNLITFAFNSCPRSSSMTLIRLNMCVEHYHSKVWRQ